jgi:arylsulfatase A-like enzyme
VDEQVGRLFDGLRARGLEKDTIVIVTGDHGEAFGDPHHTWGHGFRLYDEGIRVPFMIWSPVLFPAGGRVDTVGSHVDINPTITDLLGLPPAASWEGRSVFARDRPPRAYFYAANDDYLLGLREGSFKYIYNVTRGRDELYDLSRDPDERTNIASRHRDRCRVWRQRLAAWRHHAAGTLAAAQRQLESSTEPREARLD